MRTLDSWLRAAAASVAIAFAPSRAAATLEKVLGICTALIPDTSESLVSESVLRSTVEEATEQIAASADAFAWVKALSNSSSEPETSRKAKLAAIYYSGPRNWLIIKDRLCECAVYRNLQLEQCLTLPAEKTAVCALSRRRRHLDPACLTKGR